MTAAVRTMIVQIRILICITVVPIKILIHTTWARLAAGAAILSLLNKFLLSAVHGLDGT